MEVLRLENVSYSYKGQAKKVAAVKDATASFEAGKFYAITGRSGSGKTTLMSLIAGLDYPDSGEIVFKGDSLREIDRDGYRSKDVGMIFQSYNLLPQLTALENVMMALELSDESPGSAKSRAEEMLAKVGFDQSMIHRRVLKLSGGEQQRVAIARALSCKPALILADEPTGNLDSDTGDMVLRMLKDLAKNEDCCLIVITHEKAVADQADVKYSIHNGQLAGTDGGANR
jgi:putative ABC transport system ATP-binding protein